MALRGTVTLELEDYHLLLNKLRASKDLPKRVLDQWEALSERFGQETMALIGKRLNIIPGPMKIDEDSGKPYFVDDTEERGQGPIGG